MHDAGLVVAAGLTLFRGEWINAEPDEICAYQNVQTKQLAHLIVNSIMNLDITMWGLRNSVPMIMQ